MLNTAACWRECTRCFCFASPFNFAFTWAIGITIHINSCPVKCRRSVNVVVAQEDNFGDTRGACVPELIATARDAGMMVIHVVVAFRPGHPELSPRHTVFK